MSFWTYVKSNTRRLSLIVVAALIVPLLLAACGGSASALSCGMVVGNGQDGNDKALHYVIYPNQTGDIGSGEVEKYVPCGSRDYIINNGTDKNANGQQIGDRHTLTTAYTKSGVAITVASTAYWQLNQNTDAMTDFWSDCLKFTCASDSDVGGDVNAATAGWNIMLGEVFGAAMDRSARFAAFQMDDSIWEKHDPTLYKKLGDGMAAVFADQIRSTLGHTENLFCGSGNSQWPDKNQPGKGKFICTPVRIAVDDVQVVPQSNQSAAGAKAINEARLLNAQAVYGADAGYWLGLQDLADHCKGACTIYVGNPPSGGPTTSAPVSLPEPPATPKPSQ